jgi:hypothetical protein
MDGHSSFVFFVVVVLYSLDIVDFKNWIPDYCSFDSGNIKCDASIVDSYIKDISKEPTDDGYILLKLSNLFNEPIVVTGCQALYEEQPFCVDELTERTSFTTENQNDDFINCSKTIWAENEPLNLKLTSCEFDAYALEPGKKRKISVGITYYPNDDGPAFTKTIWGDVFTEIEP